MIDCLGTFIGLIENLTFTFEFMLNLIILKNKISNKQ